MNTESNKTSGSISELTLLVQRYRDGDRNAAEELLQRFNRYMKKWANLLYFGRWDPKDPDIQFFLRALGSVDINTTAQIVYTRLKAYERADIDQEIAVALLETALKYGNIHRYFKYILVNRVSAMIRDPLTSRYSTSIPLVELQIGKLDKVELNAAWVDGWTCGDGFDELTPIERDILRFTKYFGYTIDQTSQMLGIPVSTIDRAIRKAKVVLRVRYLEQTESKRVRQDSSR